MSDEEDKEYTRVYSAVADRAMVAHWHIPIYLSVTEHKEISRKIEDICDQPHLEALDDAIFHAVRKIVFDPKRRARQTYIWMKKPTLAKFSHLIEEASFSYYHCLFNAATVLLLIAFQGGLFSIVPRANGNYTDAQIHVRRAPLACLKLRGEAYRRHLLQFLERRLFRKTWDNPQDLFSLSHLSRPNLMKGAVHGSRMGEREAARMFLACELLSEFERCQAGNDHTLVPLDGDEMLYRRRLDVYSALSMGRATSKDLLEGYLMDHTTPRRTESPLNWLGDDRRNPLIL